MTSPFILTKIYQGLTAKNQLLKRKLKLGTSEIPIPPKRQDVTTIEAINRFNKANPRLDVNDIQPVVKQSAIKQSNVGEVDEGVIQSAFDTATVEARDGGYPPPIYETFKKRYLKRNMKADGGRAGYEDGGMLVQPSNDGSRPGYAGDDFVNLNDIKKYNKNLLDKSILVSTAPGRTGANQADRVTLRNIFNVVEKTKDGDVLINNFKKNPTSENFLKLRKRRKNRLAFEKEQALPAEQKAELRKKQLIAEKKWRASGKGQSYYNELLAKEGIFPARTAQERVWRDIYRASKQLKEDSRFKIKYPKNIEIDPETNLPKKVKAKSGKYYIPWDRYYKNVSFYDTQTKSTIKFDNMREWMKNNIKGGGKKYDNAIQNYNIKQNIADFDVDGKSLGAVAKEKKTGLYAKKLTTPAAVNHISGLNNFWDTEITTSTGNAQLNDKVQSRISAYKNASNPNIKNKILKQMKAEINKIQGGATLVVDGETIGKKPTLRKVSNALAKELDVDLKRMVAALGGGTCSVFSGKKADGGRIGLQAGTPDLDRCYNAATKVINSGKVPVDKADDFAQLLKRTAGLGKNIMKFGIIPEALYATADSLVRVGMGDTFTEAGLRATDYLLPGDQTKAAEMSKVSRFFGDETGELVGRTIDYKNQLAKIQSLEDQKANLDNLSDGGEFSYIGDLTSDSNNVEKQLIQARNNLDNKFKISEAEQLFAESKQDDAYDASKANSFFTNLKRKYRDSSNDLSDIETLAAPEKTQLELNLNMLPTAPREFMTATDDQIKTFVDIENENKIVAPAPSKLNAEEYINFRDQLKKDFMTKGPGVYGKEQVYGTQGTFGGEPVDMTNYQPNSNRFGSQQRPVLYPQGRNSLGLASGGIASLTKTIPPESGPTPHGLPYVYNNVKKI